MSPWLLTWGEGETKELSIVKEKLSDFVKVDFSANKEKLFYHCWVWENCRENQDFISCRQSEKEVGRKMELGRVDR